MMILCHHRSSHALPERQSGAPGHAQNEVGRNMDLIQELCVGLTCGQSRAQLLQLLGLVDRVMTRIGQPPLMHDTPSLSQGFPNSVQEAPWVHVFVLVTNCLTIPLLGC